MTKFMFCCVMFVVVVTGSSKGPECLETTHCWSSAELGQSLPTMFTFCTLIKNCGLINNEDWGTHLKNLCIFFFFLAILPSSWYKNAASASADNVLSLRRRRQIRLHLHPRQPNASFSCFIVSPFSLLSCARHTHEYNTSSCFTDSQRLRAGMFLFTSLPTVLLLHEEMKPFLNHFESLVSRVTVCHFWVLALRREVWHPTWSKIK